MIEINCPVCGRAMECTANNYHETYSYLTCIGANMNRVQIDSSLEVEYLCGPCSVSFTTKWDSSNYKFPAIIRREYGLEVKE